MLPKNRRISRVDISSVFVNPKKYHSSYCTLLISTQKTHTASRFCFSVPKKVDTSAVHRNKLRRQGYAVIRSYISRISPGYDYLFIYKSGASKLSFTEIETEILNLLKTASVLP